MTDPAGARPPAAPAELSSTLRRGAMISAVALVVVQAVSFLQVLFLARILDPVDIGTYAAATAFAVFLASLGGQNLGDAVIARHDEVQKAASALFWTSAGLGILFSVVALAAAPVVGMVFQSPTVGAVAAAVAGTVALQSLTVAPDSLMQRRFDFRRRMIVDPTVALSFATVSVVLALNGFGVWSLVWASYASIGSWVVVAWLLARWTPDVRGIPRRIYREIAIYSLPLAFGSFCHRLREIAEAVAVGRFLSAAALGQYRYGRRLAELPSTAITSIGGYVLFPGFSRVATDPERLRRGFQRALFVLWACALPLGGLLVVMGEPLVVVLLGERWRDAGTALVAMAAFGPGIALTSVGWECIKGCGRSQLLNRLSLLQVISGIAFLLLLLPFGLVGVGLSVSAAALLMGTVTLLRARAVVEVSVREIAAQIVPPLVAVVVAIAVVWPVEHLLLRSDSRPLLLGALLLVVGGLMFVASYLAAMRLLAPTTFCRLRREVQQFLRSRSRAGKAGKHRKPEMCRRCLD